MRRTAVALVLALVAVGFVLPSAGSAVAHEDADAHGGPVLPRGFELVSYPTGQADYNLTDFAWLPDGGLLTSGKDGTVTFAPPGGTPRVIGQVPNVRVAGDHGMLGFAPANDYATSGRVFVTFDQGEAPGVGQGRGVGMVEEWRASPAEDPQTFTRTRTLVDGATMSPALDQVTRNHGLDSVVVAPDDTLFVSVGDDSLNNGEPNTLRAQDVDLPYGKILHLTETGDGVASNPFFDDDHPHSWRSMVYAYGFRNPFRFDVDARNGRLQLGDVGWGQWEEVDSVVKGMNGGWPCYEGKARTVIGSDELCQRLYADKTATAPMFTYAHNDQSASITGGAFYKGSSYPAAYRGAWFFGDYAKSTIWTLKTNAAGSLVRTPEANGFGKAVGGPVAFHRGPNGDITYADITSGTVQRLVYTSANRAPVPHIEYTGDPDTNTVSYSAAGSRDPDGDAITYAWDLGDGTSSTSKSPSHAYPDAAPRTVTLTVRDSHGKTGTTTVLVHPGNHRPLLTMVAPPDGTTFAVGDPVRLTATASDAEDGPLAVHWQSALKHCPGAESCHLHPEGSSSGSTYSEDFPDHTFDTTILVTAKATDATGTTTTATFEAKPRLHTVTVAGVVPGAVNGVRAGAAQAVEGSEVQVEAPSTSLYWTWQAWSDGGAASHSFTMPDHDVALSLTYVTSIDQRYSQLGGAASFLAAPIGVERDTAAGGRSRTYAGGRMYWGRSSGTHYLTGGILKTYVAQRGPAGFGLPTTDNVTVSGGAYAHFTGNRSIFRRDGHRAHPVRGAIRTRYRALGFQTSCLGFPVGAQSRIASGLRQRFEHGTLTYTSKTKKTARRCS